MSKFEIRRQKGVLYQIFGLMAMAGITQNNGIDGILIPSYQMLKCIRITRQAFFDRLHIVVYDPPFVMDV